MEGKRVEKRIVLIGLCLVMLLAFSACNTPNVAEEKSVPAESNNVEAKTQVEESIEVANEEKYVVGVCVYSREHVFFNIIEEAMKEYAPSLNMELIVVDSQGDDSIQYNQVQDFITQKVDAIAIASVTASGSVQTVDLANEAGIPIFTLNIASDGDVVGHVGSNEVLGGQIAGNYAAEVLDGKGKVAVITVETSPPCKNREKGFVGIMDQYPDMEVIATNDYMGDANKALSITQDWLTTYPDIDLIFATGDPAATGALSAIKTAGSDCMVIGYDGNPEAFDAIKNDGDIWIADVAQDAAGNGTGTLDVIYEYLTTSSCEKETLIDGYLIDATYIEENNL